VRSLSSIAIRGLLRTYITIACLYKLITAVVLGLVYLFVITGLAKVAFGGNGKNYRKAGS
jgi:hypothetical protein